MRFRLLRRRLTISAPRVAVRSSLPWPLRWIGAALVLGFCAAVSLWAFEFGKEIAGLERNAKEELAVLRTDNARLREERDRAQEVVNTSTSLATADKAAQDRLLAQMRQLESDNQALRDDLAFFERLLPADGSDGLSIRGLQAERIGDDSGHSQVKWQVLVIQAGRNPAAFNGALELTLAGTLAGKPWTQGLAQGPQVLQIKQYRRIEGVLDLPAQVVLKSVTARVTEGAATKAVQAVKL